MKKYLILVLVASNLLLTACGRDFFQLQKVGEYVVLARIASGGMSDLFLATEGTGSRKQFFILKSARAQHADDPSTLTMLRHEAAVLKRLSHPGIVAVHECIEHNGQVYIVMDLVEGKDLEALIRRAVIESRKLSLSEVVAISLSAAEALSYAHDFSFDRGKPLNLIHRDVTPRNIMIAVSGQTVLLDFGIASSANRPILTKTGKVRGTPIYLAPEQRNLKPASIQSDIFSLTLIICDLLFGLLEELAPAAKRREQIKTSALPPAMKALLIKGLEEDPVNRWESMSELAQALRPLIAGVSPNQTLSALFKELFPDYISPASNITPEQRRVFQFEQNLKRLPVYKHEDEDTDEAASTVNSEVRHWSVSDSAAGPTKRRFSSRLIKQVYGILIAFVAMGGAAVYFWNQNSVLYLEASIPEFRISGQGEFCQVKVESQPSHVTVFVEGRRLQAPTPLFLSMPCSKTVKVLYDAEGFEPLLEEVKGIRHRHHSINLQPSSSWMTGPQFWWKRFLSYF